MKGRVLAVDPGEKRLGIAVGDPTGVIASPYKVIQHVSLQIDAAEVARLAAELDIVLILVGQPLDDEGQASTPEARHSDRVAEAIRSHTSIPVQLWDESHSTQDAQSVRRAMGVSRRNRSGHLDDLAAAVILQNFLDVHASGFGGSGS